jgi:hypothetical protein
MGSALVNAFDSAIGLAIDAINVGIGVIDGSIAALGEGVGVIGQSITDAVTSVGEGVNSIGQTITDTWAKVGEIATSITAPATIAVDFAPLSVAGSLVANKFPFCIPFDLVNSVASLNVAAVAPHWVINFPANYFVGGGHVDIDFTQFETWAVVVRWGLLISFSLGLILITRQIIGGE